MKRPIVYSRRAARELDEIYLYSCGEWDLEVAGRYLRGLEAACSLLARHPRAGRKVSRFRRRFRYERHLVHCRYRRRSETIEILRIVHEKRAPPSHL